MVLRDTACCVPCVALILLCLVFCGCNANRITPAGLEAAAQVDGSGANGAGWPSALPADGVQPWEQLDVQGFVMPSAANGRSASAIALTSEFIPGRERFLEGGSVADLDEASNLRAEPGGSELSWAMYRISLGGVQPGAASVDANLLPTAGSGGVSPYYVGLSDYARGVWDWRGPFTDSHVRLSLMAGDWLSPLGNLFMCIAVHEDSQINVVGVAANPADAADLIAPPAPAALAATPVQGGLLLEWTPSAAGDLAGYSVYWSYSPITDPPGAGVNQVGYLEGKAHHVLMVPEQRIAYVRVSAVDVSRNESVLCPQASGMPLAGDAPFVICATDAVSGAYGLNANLMAAGADLYDWDLDGDGLYDITDDASGTQTAVLMEPGIIRPAVRGHSPGGTAVACGAVSLIVTGNTRPAASCVVTPSQGEAPLVATFTGEAYDAEDDPAELRYSWDINGDGIYVGSGLWNSLTPPNGTYTTPGLYNVKFRVEDSQGAWDVDSMAVHVEPASPPVNVPPHASCVASQYYLDTVPGTVSFNPGASSDPDGTIVKYEWDFNGDDSYDSVSYTSRPVTHTFTQKGIFSVGLRVTDDAGDMGYIGTPIRCGGACPMDGGNLYRSRFEWLVGPQTNHEAYAVDVTSSTVSSQPVVSNEGFVYILDHANKLQSLYPDLTQRWEVTLAAATTDEVGPVLDTYGNIYVTDAEGNTYCFDPLGNQLWFRDLNTSFSTRPLLDTESLRYYVLADNGDLYCLDLRTGVPIWNAPYSSGGSINQSSPTFDAEGNIFFGDGSGHLHGVLPDGTALSWSPFDTGLGSTIYSSPAYDSFTNTIVFCARQNAATQGVVFKIYPYDGSLVWSTPLGTANSFIDTSPALDDNGNVYIGTWDDKVYALGTYDGLVLPGWPATTGADIDSCSAVVDANWNVYLGSWDNKVYCFDNTGFQQWVSADSGNVFAASLAIGPGGKVYAVNNVGKVIVFDGN